MFRIQRLLPESEITFRGDASIMSNLTSIESDLFALKAKFADSYKVLIVTGFSEVDLVRVEHMSLSCYDGNCTSNEGAGSLLWPTDNELPAVATGTIEVV